MNKRQQRAAKIAAQQALVNGAKTAGRDLTPEEQAQFDTLQREIEALDVEIANEERQEGAQTGQEGQTGTTQTRAAGTGADTGDEANRAAQRAVTEERQRVQDISNLCREFGVDAAEHIQQGHTVDQVRAAILDGLRATGNPVHVQVTRDEGDTFRQRATDALLLRAGVQVQAPAEGLTSSAA